MPSSLRKLSGTGELSSESKKGGPNLAGTIRSLLFFILFYLYLQLYVDLRLIYYSGGIVTNFPAFFRGWAFFREFTSYPGGPAEYAAAFLAQFFYVGWAGPLVVTLQAWLICVCTGSFLKAVNAPALRFVRYIPAILLLVICSQYAYFFAVTTSLSAALLFVCVYIKITPRQNSSSNRWASGLWAVVLFPALSVILYYIAGAAYLLFALLCAIRELRSKRRWLGILFLLCGASIPYITGTLILGDSILNAYWKPLPAVWKISKAIKQISSKQAFYPIFGLSLFLAVFAFVLWRLLAGRQRFATTTLELDHGQKPRENSRPVSNFLAAVLSRYARSPVFKWVIGSLVTFAIAGGAAFFSHNSGRKTALEVHYYTCRRMWPQALRAASRKPNSPFIINAVNRALYHTGRLGCDMFAYPQHPGALLLTGEDHVLAYWHKFDTLIDLGLTNMAQKNLAECMEVYGEHPLILKRLALINLVKADYPAARVYLQALGKTLFHADWANNYLALLKSNPNLSTDDRIWQLRSVGMKKDHPTIFFSNELIFKTLLHENDRNRMAFEYLMSWYLLTKQPEKIIQNIESLSDLGYSKIPPLYEEAIFIYSYSTKRTVFLQGLQLSAEARRRMEHFSHVFDMSGRNKQTAVRNLAKDYGNSYFFYHLYDFSGVQN